MPVFDIKAAPYNAVGDYATDDTAAIQAAINDAQAVGGKVIAPYGRYRTSSPLLISDRITLVGDGYSDDSGQGYKSSIAFNSSLKGTVFYPGNHDAFQSVTNAAVMLEKFQIAYNQTQGASGSGHAAIRASSAVGAGNSNTRSVFRDICITCADYGLILTNLLGFKVDNVNSLYGWNGGIQVSSPNYPSFGDSSIANCEMWGNGGNVGNQYSSHISVLSGGGLRILNNKLNFGDGSGGSGILLVPSLAVQQTMEPIIISGNSIEGQAVGINIANGNPANAIITEVVISGNQIWSGINAIRSNTNGAGKWLVGFTVTGNALMVNGGSNKTIVEMDCSQLGIITGNQFSLANGGTGWGVNLGPNTAKINVQSNIYAAGLVPVLNGGVGNTIGGGSP